MIDGVLHSLGGTNSKERSTLCLLRNHNGTERTGADGGFFCTVRIVLFCFPPVKAAEYHPETPAATAALCSPTSTQQSRTIDLLLSKRSLAFQPPPPPPQSSRKLHIEMTSANLCLLKHRQARKKGRRGRGRGVCWERNLVNE